MEYLEKTTLSHEDGLMCLTEFSVLVGDSPDTCYREALTVRQLIRILGQLDRNAVVFVAEGGRDGEGPTEYPLMKVTLRGASGAGGEQRVVL